jgi:hypothetical protein
MKEQTKPNGNGVSTITIPDLKTGMLVLTVTGTTPLICHKFSTKSKEMMRAKQAGEAKHKKAPKNPEEEFQACLYPMPGKKESYGFPASGFKKAAVSACRYADGINMTFAKGAFHVVGDLLEIKGSKPKMREDIVRLNSGPKPVADIRYRAEFDKWAVEIPVRFNSAAITPSMIVNLFNIAGFSVGIGEWRPEKSGSFGMFEIQKQAEVTQ